MATFNTSKYSPFGKLGKDIKAGKYTSKKEPPKYIFETNQRGRKVKKLNPRWTAWSKRQKTKTNKTENKSTPTFKQSIKAGKELNKTVKASKNKPKPEVKKKDTPKTEVKKESPQTTLKIKPRKMHAIEKGNRKRFGDAHVDKLKKQYADFKAKRKKKK